MIWNLKKRPQSALGLTLHNSQLRAVQVTRSKGAMEVVKSAAAALSLDLLHPESELIGREIRNHLDAAGIRERNAVVAVPASWIMSQHTKLPELSPEDVDSYLQLEAEKGFPCDAAQLQIARSFHRTAAGTYVTQLAIRKERLDHLTAVVKAAGLKPVSFSLGLAALPDVIAPVGKGRITVEIDPKGAVLLVSAGGGIAAFRTCEAAIESEAGENVVNGGAVARELRITVEQLSADLRADLKQLWLCGDQAMVSQLAEGLGEWPGAAGLKVESGDSAADQAAQIAEDLARHWLVPAGPELEFLPPDPGRWTVLMARYNSKRLATAGFAVGGIVVITLAAFGWQEFRLTSLRSEWGAIQAPVADLTALQDRIREYHPWYDRSFPDLRILGRVTRCFPDNGSVTAKSFEIQQLPTGTTVSISGTASDDRALLRTQDLLRQAKEIEGLNVENISGKLPARFTLTFHWIGGS